MNSPIPVLVELIDPPKEAPVKPPAPVRAPSGVAPTGGRPPDIQRSTR